jgi:hypothetical protein
MGSLVGVSFQASHSFFFFFGQRFRVGDIYMFVQLIEFVFVVNILFV